MSSQRRRALVLTLVPPDLLRRRFGGPEPRLRSVPRPGDPRSARSGVLLRGPWPAAAPEERVAAEPPEVRVRGSRSGDLDRPVQLLARWLDLSRSLAATDAHGDRDGLLAGEHELLESLDDVEALLGEQVVDARALLDGLAGWAAGLQHDGFGGDRAVCLTCRRAAAASGGLPDDHAWARRLLLEQAARTPGPELPEP